MKVDGNQLKPGNVIVYQDRLWRVLKTQHVKPGKGGAYMQAEMRNINDGSKTNTRFRSSESVERAFIERRKHTRLYGDSTNQTFMDTQSFEQIMVSNTILGDNVDFMQDGMEVELELYEGGAIGVTLPESIALEVEQTDAAIKGQTATGSYKPAILSNGIRVMVPPYIDTGDTVLVRTSDREFLSRAK